MIQEKDVKQNESQAFPTIIVWTDDLGTDQAGQNHRKVAEQSDEQDLVIFE